MRIPLSTYRLQFGGGFGFRHARELTPYLHRLGITDVYASPVFQAQSDSSSGYDIVDPTRLDSKLGSCDEFFAFCEELKRHDMGLLLDIVPNHMSASSSNVWWRDVLENGPGSPYAHYFDIEWDPPSRSRSGKMLWPILGAPYAEVLERRELLLAFTEEGFAIRYFDRSLPLDPATYGVILSHLPDDERITELERLAESLPASTETDPASVDFRRLQTRELKSALWRLCSTDQRFRSRLDDTLKTFNGEPSDPRSFDLLDDLLGRQPYILSFWRVAREKVNYRRFFDIAGLVGVNVEEPEVFAATHSLVFRLVDEGWVSGLRIDHIDGLYDPAEYLRRLRERLPDCFIVVEKILEGNETLCPEWPVAGTTGYDFVNALGSAMLDPAGLDRLTAGYLRIAGAPGGLADIAYEQRLRVIEDLFAGEAHSLSLHLNLLAELDRHAKDVSPQELSAALMKVTACLPVYRTYTRSFQIRSQDQAHIDEAFHEARRRNPGLSEAIWNFIRRVLLLECPPSLSVEQRADWKQFVLRWQQFSGPVMAKGKEDTAFYIYNRLISMNEVGGQDQPWSVEDFHRFAGKRAASCPHTLNAGTTHDTKRGEDVRARLNVLTAMPEVWTRCVRRWQRWNSRCKGVLNGAPVPDTNEEYFIYQTLAGAWPLDAEEIGPFEQQRLPEVLVKSWREAKLHTSWSSRDTGYENAVADFVTTILTPAEGNRFLPDFIKFQRRVSMSGAFHSLSQTLLRLASPGIPDTYQGAELWELSLVDPDNRRPVDFAKRQTQLEEIKNCSISCLLRNWHTGAVKQYVIQRTLACRNDHPDVFRTGEYVALEAAGKRGQQVIAFARHSGMEWVVAIAPRFSGGQVWGDTDLGFPATAPRRWRSVFTGHNLEIPGTGRVALSGILRRFPIALLTSLPD